MVSLRKFPALPEGGEADGVTWLQTTSKITLSFALAHDVEEADVEVKITGFQVEVKVKGEKVKALTGELYELVRRPPSSWWVLDTTEGRPTIVLQFVKIQHRAWPECWYSGAMHPRKKGRFAWNDHARKMMASEAELIRLNDFEIVQPGRPEEEDTAWYPPTHSTVFSPKPDTYLCSPDDIVIGTNVKQDNQKLYLYIHFDYEALNFFEQTRCIEDLFGADLTYQTAYVFIRGDDQNPIINATLMGEIVPEACTWKMVTDEVYRKRQKAVGAQSPALLVTMEKAAGFRYEWPQVFQQCWQHRLMVKNQEEYEEMLDAAQELSWATERMDPEQKAALEEKAAGLSTFVEERFDGIPEAFTYRRHGYDLDSPDYWANVYDYVNDTVNNFGCDSAPTALAVVEAQ